MESPLAYSVMAITILIDAYLLYIFFTMQKTLQSARMGHKLISDNGGDCSGSVCKCMS